MSKQRFLKKDHIFVSYAKITNYTEITFQENQLIQTANSNFILTNETSHYTKHAV